MEGIEQLNLSYKVEKGKSNKAQEYDNDGMTGIQQPSILSK